MARTILWFQVIMGSLFVIFGSDPSMFNKVATLSSLGILALCESIERKPYPFRKR